MLWLVPARRVVNSFYPDECRVVMSAIIREKGFARRNPFATVPFAIVSFVPGCRGTRRMCPILLVVARSWIEDAKLAKALNLHDKLVRSALSVMTADLLLQRCPDRDRCTSHGAEQGSAFAAGGRAQ